MQQTSTMIHASGGRTHTHHGTHGAHAGPKSINKVRHTPGASRIRSDELPAFTRGVAAMLEAGLPLIACLQAMEEQVKSAAFRHALQSIRTSVQYGNRLSMAMSSFPDIFDDIFVSMLRTGEISGKLPETLERLADHLESAADLRHKVQSALMYPIAVAGIATLLACAIMIWIVPAFERIYIDLGGRLPAPTRALIACSHALRTHGIIIVIACVCFVLGVQHARHTPKGAYFWDRILLQLPVFGVLMQKIALARFAEAMSQMVHNGVSILKAIELSSRVTNNKVLSRVLDRAHREVEQGAPFSTTLRQSRWYPQLLVQMLAIGERTGRMDDMLERVGKFYRNEVTVMLKGLTSLIEPLLIVFLGVVVGGMVVCMFIPIFRLHELVKF
jgi:type IV pilus assembly protein PilC